MITLLRKARRSVLSLLASMAALALGEGPPANVPQPGQEEAEKIFILVAELINPDQVRAST